MSLAETQPVESREKTTQAFAVGGLTAGLLASSCCVLPLLLVTVGISGAWISQLTALAPYQPLFLGAAALALGIGFWRVYRRRVCAIGTLCERPRMARTAKILLWFGLVVVLAAMSVNFLTPLLL